MSTPLSTRPRTLRLIVVLLGCVLISGVAATLVSASSLPTCRIDDIKTEQRALEDWDRSVLDPTYRLTKGYAPPDLRSTSNADLNGGHKVRAFVISDLRAMATAARKAGARLAVQSAYRSYATQKATFSYWVRVLGKAEALRTSARAGHSEHQLGTTIDFRAYGGPAPWDLKGWGKTTVGTWLRKNAWKYGFTKSYPKGMKDVTCYSLEPWHFRYVGREKAALIRGSGLTLREYLWAEQTTPTPSPTPTPEPTPTPTPTPMPEPTPTEAPPVPPA
jgi:D-alanyl-D-alanine carboxypeptidase